MSRGQPIHEGRAAASPPLGPLEALFEPGYPESWRELATALYLDLAQPGQLSSLPEAARLALAQTRRLASLFGGGTLYIGSGATFEAKAMARRVVADFNGRNLDALARREGVTTMRVRQILAANDKAKRQKYQEKGQQ